MIRSFGGSKTRRLFEDGRRRGFLDAAKSLGPLGVLQAVRLHPLTGPRRGRWAMTVNARWRVTFQFADGDAHDVEIEDYHRG